MIPKPPEDRLVLVLDTNVCLDLFVFHDPRWTALLTAIQEKRVRAITRASCRDEWLAVLHYKQLPINDETRPMFAAAFDQWIECVAPDARSLVALPLCSDPDDQQFMELARDSGATHLITKDKALLKCAKRIAKLKLFNILTPEDFLKKVRV